MIPKKFVFLETLTQDKSNQKNFFFTNPIDYIDFYVHQDVSKFFLKIEKALAAGYYVAGYFTYEFGYALEPRFKRLLRHCKNKKLASFGIFKNFTFLDPQSKADSSEIKRIQCQIKEKKYFNDIKKIKKYIEDGDVYQINYTTKILFDYFGSYFNLYNQLKQEQSVSYAGIVNLGEPKILTFSPELFFSVVKNKITVKPMKGTVQRGETTLEDKKNIEWLKQSKKNQSENIMIVDLMRNDLGKICKTGSVKVKSFYDIETYETLFQMTSQIQGDLKEKISILEMMKALFPSGSVTGAPKIRAMEIIHELEKFPRGIYTGAIGYFSPLGDMCFNVAIRTIELALHKGRMGIGSGIVYDSDPKSEYEECLLKAKFLTQKKFELIETILWDKKYFLLPLHLQRLKQTAKHFDFVYKENAIKQVLQETEKKFKKEKKYKVRMLLSKQGKIKISIEQLSSLNAKVKRIKISKIIMNSKDEFLQYKTTQRKIYDEEYQKAKEQGYDEVIFLNEKGEITEGSRTNIIIEKNGQWYTPPVCCGLLNGVYRQYLLKQRKVKEKILTRQDLISADKIFVCNSVQGLVKSSLS